MKEIKFELKVAELPKLTGAAAAAAEAAESKVMAEFGAITIAAKLMSDSLNTPAADVNATTIYVAMERHNAFEKLIKKSREEWPKRFKIVVHTFNNWPIHRNPGGTGMVFDAAYEYHERLTDAGIPMPEYNGDLIQYWKDAAARGC